MVTAVTLGFTKKGADGKPVYAVITDPNTPHKAQRRAFRHLRRELHGKFDEVQLWTSAGGRVKRQRTTERAVAVVLTPVAAPAPKKAKAKAPEPVAVVPTVELSASDAAASLLGETVAPSTDTVAPATVPVTSAAQPAPTTPSTEDAKKAKRSENLAKAQAAAKAKRDAKAKAKTAAAE